MSLANEGSFFNLLSYNRYYITVLELAVPGFGVLLEASVAEASIRKQHGLLLCLRAAILIQRRQHNSWRIEDLHADSFHFIMVSLDTFAHIDEKQYPLFVAVLTTTASS